MIITYHHHHKRLLEKSLNQVKKLSTLLQSSLSTHTNINNNTSNPNTFYQQTKYNIFQTKVYQKLYLKRLPEEEHTIFIHIEDKVSKLFEHLNKLYPDKQHIALNRLEMKIGETITEEDELENEKVKDYPLLEALLSGNLVVYERSGVGSGGDKDAKALGGDKCELCYGLEIAELNYTNNRNLPEKISQNIIELSEQWQAQAERVSNKNSPSNSINALIINKEETNIYSPEVLTEIEAERENQTREYHIALMNYKQVLKFSKQDNIYDSKQTHQVVVNLLALMTLNWWGLFAITYGGYGWDVGEPVSYLSGLGVDVIAMMGLFDAEEKIHETGKVNFERMCAVINVESYLKLKEYQIAHLKRML